MKKRILFALLLITMLLFTGCDKESPSSDNEISSNDVETTPEFSDNLSSDMFTDRDFEIGYDEKNAAFITLKGDTASCDSNAVEIFGSTVTIKDEGTYILSGSLNDGMIIVDAEKTDKPQIVLNNVSISSGTSAPLYILQADKVFVTLSEGSENTLTNGGTFAAIDDNNIDAAIFSKDDLTLNGSGTLTITSPSGHGIVSKDDLVLTSGFYIITAASHALSGKDSVRIANASVTTTSGKDGIHAENAEDTTLGFLYIKSGIFNITADGDGVSSSSYMQIENGEFIIDSSEDAVHSNSSLLVHNGIFEISTDDDGFHADKNLTIASGTINILQSYEGLEGLNIDITGGNIHIVASDDGLNSAGGNDESGYGGPHENDIFAVDENSYINISGGTFIASGSSQMAMNFDTSSTQGVMLVSTGTQAIGSLVEIYNSDGDSLLSWESTKEFSCIVLSCPELLEGETYSLTAGTASADVTMESLVMGKGQSAMPGGMGGGMPGGDMPGRRF